MNVCVDIQSMVGQRAGVGRYTSMLVRHLAQQVGSDALRLFCFDFLGKAQDLKVPGTSVQRVGWCPGRLAQWSWKRLGVPAFERFAGPADVFHFPNFIIPPMRTGHRVVTIHDVSFLRFPQFAEERNLHHLTSHIRDTVNRADAIITDSRFSASEIVELLGASPDRVVPIHLGIDRQFASCTDEDVGEVRIQYGLTRPYLLAVGTVEPRKNIDFLLDVFENLSSFDGHLVIAGAPGWKSEATVDRFRQSPRRDAIHWLHYVNDADLAALYKGATAFVTPSHYEGFGFPPLEAMAAGVPVLSSGGGSLREILGDAALTVTPFDRDLWIQNLHRIIHDTELRRDLSARGQTQVARYTWQETARQTWTVYRGLK
jgi:glycosyltransferase involved in cell wall biosynthesis